jgi:hypothetical protein
MEFDGEVRKICREGTSFVKIGPVTRPSNKGVNKFLTEFSISPNRFSMKFHVVDLHLMPFSSYYFLEKWVKVTLLLIGAK